jgi:Holliday junction resolvase RusA-like endonuclease
MKSVSLVIMGTVYSLKNSHIWTKGRSIKHPKAAAFERDFAYQVRPEHRLNLGSPKQPLRANVSVWYPSRRQDLSAEIVYDLLQKCGIIANDRFVVEKHEYAHVDPKNPRVEIIIEEL